MFIYTLDLLKISFNVNFFFDLLTANVRSRKNQAGGITNKFIANKTDKAGIYPANLYKNAPQKKPAPLTEFFAPVSQATNLKSFDWCPFSSSFVTNFVTDFPPNFTISFAIPLNP